MNEQKDETESWTTNKNNGRFVPISAYKIKDTQIDLPPTLADYIIKNFSFAE